MPVLQSLLGVAVGTAVGYGINKAVKATPKIKKAFKAKNARVKAKQSASYAKMKKQNDAVKRKANMKAGKLN